MNNYSEFEEYLKTLKEKPKLLLHSCCAPCSTSVLELLTKYFKVDIYYYNPNIYPESEYLKRKNEQKRLINLLKEDINFIETEYDNNNFDLLTRGLETEKEGGLRCNKCISFRMENACRYAKEHNYDFFTTTLSVSPHKNSKMINEIGYNLEKKYSMPYLYSDFKKKDGYKKSIFLSKEYNLYRQNYCGCKYSIRNL
ncbi:MAG: epoxyqueuosine reductase QueH [Bacilli bacterium]